MTIKYAHENLENENWLEKKLAYPNNTIRLATMFSGIGAVEFALKRLQLKSKIQNPPKKPKVITKEK